MRDRVVPDQLRRLVCRLVKFPMEICFPSTDDPRRVWRPWEEPPACSAGSRNDAGGSRGAQRRPCHRGQPHRERQARPEGLDRAPSGKSGRRRCGRPPSLSFRPAPAPLRVTGGRPSGLCLVLLEDLQQRHDLVNGPDLHPNHLPPARQLPAFCRGGRERVGNLLVLGNSLHGQKGRQSICSAVSDCRI